MWIVFKTATSQEVIDKEGKEAIVKGLRLLILVGNEEESLTASQLLHEIIPPPKTSHKKHGV